MIDNQRTEIVSKFEAIISGRVKKEVAMALKPLQEKVSQQSETIGYIPQWNRWTTNVKS